MKFLKALILMLVLLSFTPITLHAFPDVVTTEINNTEWLPVVLGPNQTCRVYSITSRGGHTFKVKGRLAATEYKTILDGATMTRSEQTLIFGATLCYVQSAEPTDTLETLITNDKNGWLGIEGGSTIIQGTVSEGNATVADLGIGGVYTGAWEEIKNAAIIKVNIFTDQASAVDGLDFQQSPDKVIIFDEKYTLGAGDKKLFTPNPVARYFRIVYTNGAVANAVDGFSLQTIYSYVYTKPTSHRIGDTVSENDDAELVKSVIGYQQDPDGKYNNVSIQNPFPVDGDSVYSKDIWIAESIIGDFSGSVTDLFDNLHSTITNVTATNPKELTIHFNKTVISNVLGLGSYSGDFSNVEIQLLFSGGGTLTVVDESADTTKYTTRTWVLPLTAGFNGIKFLFHTADTVTISNCVIPKLRATVARLQAVSESTGKVEDIQSFNGALNVTDGLVHKAALDLYFTIEAGNNTTPSAPISVGDRVVAFNSVTGLSSGTAATPDGDYIELSEGSVYEMTPLQIIDITGNNVTFNRPIDNAYTTAADLKEVLRNLNVDGSTTAQSFKVQPPSTQVWQFTRLILYGLDDATMQDTNFMGLPALERGVILRTYKNGVFISSTAWHSTGDMANDMYDLTYPDKVPAGKYSVRGRFTVTNFGAIVELNGANGDYAEVLVQDNLTPVENYSMKIQGRIFGN